MRIVFESLCNEAYRVHDRAPDGSIPRGYVRFVESDVGYDVFGLRLPLVAPGFYRVRDNAPDGSSPQVFR